MSNQQNNDEPRTDIPCNYCSGTISVTTKAKSMLGMTWGVCANCKELIKNAQICEQCHHKLFKTCDWKNSESFGRCDHKAGEQLHHFEWGEHICNYHHRIYHDRLRALYSND